MSAVTVSFVSTRVVLRSPFGETVVRDIVAGKWAEPNGIADETLGGDLWALPGLVDAHAHIAAADLYQPGVLEEAQGRARAALTAGVTLLIDKGWGDQTAIEVISTVPEGERPEIEAAAEVIAVPGGYFPDFALEIDHDDLAQVVAAQAQAGQGWVKMIGDWPRRGVGPVANFSEDELRLAVSTAGRFGARVAIHTMAREVPSAAVAAGVHSIEHGLFLTEDDVEALGSRRGMWVPTVLRMEETLRQLGAESSGGKLISEGLDNMRTLLPIALETGVYVLAGTDLMGTPANIANEALRLTSYGLSDIQALGAVGPAGFKATDRSPRFTIGDSADAALFPADPLQELSVLSSPSLVIRKGVMR